MGFRFHPQMARNDRLKSKRIGLLAGLALAATFSFDAFADTVPSAGSEGQVNTSNVPAGKDLVSPGLASRLVSEDPSKTPQFIKYLLDRGMFLTSLPPTISGLEGYTVEDKSGRDVIMYITPDGKSAVVGVMLSVGNGLTNGQPENVTAIQLASLRARLVAAKEKGETKNLPIDAKQAIDNNITPVSAVSVNDPSLAKPFMTTRKASDFQSEMEKTKYLSIGYNGKPVLWFVADPQCQYCHRAWGKISQLVMTGKISVNVILIGALPGSSTIARDILSRNDPGEAWMSGEGSTDDGYHPSSHNPSGEAASKADSYLAANMAFVRAEGVKRTPWMGYVGKDKKTVYTHEGADQIEAFLSGI